MSVQPTRPAVLLVATLLLTTAVVGCTRDGYVGDIPAELTHTMQDYIGYVSDLAVALENISDPDSAEAALDDIADAAAGMAITRAILSDASVRHQVRLELRYEDQVVPTRNRVSHEAVRLMSKKPTALVLRMALARVPGLLRSAAATNP